MWLLWILDLEQLVNASVSSTDRRHSGMEGQMFADQKLLNFLHTYGHFFKFGQYYSFFWLFSLTWILWWNSHIKQADNNYITWATSFTFLIESDKCWNMANSSHSSLPRIFSWWVTLLHSSQSPSSDLTAWPFLPHWHKCRCLLHHPCGNRLSGPASLDC